MPAENFFPVRKLSDVLNVRKVSDDGCKVNWLSIK